MKINIEHTQKEKSILNPDHPFNFITDNTLFFYLLTLSN